MERFFKLKQNGTTVGRELVAGFTTFFAMAYIIAVNPTLLSQSGMEWGAVFLATIISSIIGTLVMGLVANVPYALAPGMGLNAFFVYTVCFTLGFTWQQALSMVFICGLINIIITVTKVRKYIIKAIPRSLQNAIGGGIGIFVAYIGLLNVGIITFDSGVPALVVVGIMMLSAFKEIKWDDFDEAIPAFFAGIFMAICYSISYGIAAGFIFYCITKICKKQAKQIHPILWGATVLFILNFVLLTFI